jgi:hypothetical protein
MVFPLYRNLARTLCGARLDPCHTSDAARAMAVSKRDRAVLLASL